MTARLPIACALVLSLATVLGQSVEPTPAQIGWLKANAIEVKTVDAGSGFSDLQRLKAAIGSARKSGVRRCDGHFSTPSRRG